MSVHSEKEELESILVNTRIGLVSGGSRRGVPRTRESAAWRKGDGEDGKFTVRPESPTEVCSKGRDLTSGLFDVSPATGLLDWMLLNVLISEDTGGILGTMEAHRRGRAAA